MAFNLLGYRSDFGLMEELNQATESRFSTGFKIKSFVQPKTAFRGIELDASGQSGIAD